MRKTWQVISERFNLKTGNLTNLDLRKNTSPKPSKTINTAALLPRNKNGNQFLTTTIPACHTGSPASPSDVEFPKEGKQAMPEQLLHCTVKWSTKQRDIHSKHNFTFIGWLVVLSMTSWLKPVFTLKFILSLNGIFLLNGFTYCGKVKGMVMENWPCSYIKCWNQLISTDRIDPPSTFVKTE